MFFFGGEGGAVDAYKKSTYENNIHSFEWITIVTLRFNFQWFQFHFNSGWLWQACVAPFIPCRMCIFHIDGLLHTFVCICVECILLISRCFIHFSLVHFMALPRCWVCWMNVVFFVVFWGYKCNGYYVLRINRCMVRFNVTNSPILVYNLVIIKKRCARVGSLAWIVYTVFSFLFLFNCCQIVVFRQLQTASMHVHNTET